MLDARYAPALVVRSYVLRSQASLGWIDGAQGHQKARADAERAIALDPNLGAGYSALALVQMTYEWDWEGTEASLKKAAELEPGSADVLRIRAGLVSKLARQDEAIDFQRQAIELDPLRAQSYVWMGIYLYYAGRYEEADASLRKGLELREQYSAAHYLRGRVMLAEGRPKDALAEMAEETGGMWKLTGEALSYHALGRRQDSDAALAKLIAKYDKDAAYQVAEVYAYRSETEKVFEWLKRAYQA